MLFLIDAYQHFNEFQRKSFLTSVHQKYLRWCLFVFDFGGLHLCICRCGCSGHRKNVVRRSKSNNKALLHFLSGAVPAYDESSAATQRAGHRRRHEMIRRSHPPFQFLTRPNMVHSTSQHVPTWSQATPLSMIPFLSQNSYGSLLCL